MKTTCRRFPNAGLDRTGTLRRLEKMAQKGWEPTRVSPLFDLVHFQRTTSRDLHFSLDWTDPERQEDPAYIKLCADAGWHPVGKLGSTQLYIAHSQGEPIPIQTDPMLEYQRFYQKSFRGLQTALLCYLVFGLNLFRFTSRFSSDFSRGGLYFLERLFSSSTLEPLLLLLLPLITLSALVGLFFTLFQLYRWKKAAQNGHPFPSLLPWQSQLWILSNHMIGFMFFVLILAWLADCLFNGISLLFCAAVILVLTLIASTAAKHLPQVKACYPFFWSIAAFVLAISILHYPIRTLLPYRIPPDTITEGYSKYQMSNEKPTDTLWGSFIASDCPGPGSSRVFYDVYAWSSPAMTQRFLQNRTREMTALPGYSSVWENDLGDCLIARGNAYLILWRLDKDIRTSFLPTAITWLESWA